MRPQQWLASVRHTGTSTTSPHPVSVKTYQVGVSERVETDDRGGRGGRRVSDLLPYISSKPALLVYLAPLPGTRSRVGPPSA